MVRNIHTELQFKFVLTAFKELSVKAKSFGGFIIIMLNVFFGKPKRYSRIFMIHLNTLEVRLQINRMFSYGPVLSLEVRPEKNFLPFDGH